MDPRSSAQDVIRCDFCETAVVQMHCDVCHINLCIACIGKHVSEDYEKHKVVPFKQRRSTLIYPKCTTHPTKTCDLQCKECNIPVCSLCSVSIQHKRHDCSDLSEIYAAKKESIRNDKTELENFLSPTYKTILTDLEIQIVNLDSDYGKLTELVTKRGDEWHREIDRITKKLKNEINEMKSKHQGILKQHLDEIKQIQSLMDQALLTLKKIEESNEVTMVLEYTSKIKEFSKLPPKLQVSLPTFSPQNINSEQVSKLFGSLTPISTSTVEEAYRLKKTEAAAKELLEEPMLINTINTGYEKVYSVACHDEEVWTRAKDSKLKCISIQGSLKKTVETKSGERPTDITVTSDGDLVYSDWKTKTVNKVKDGQTEEVIRLQGWIPRSLCVTSSGDLLVTMYSDDETKSKVVRYSGSTEKQTIQFNDKGNPLYSGNNNTKYISENRNLDICVADYKASAVVVVNQPGKFMFRYTGHSCTTMKQPFKPLGITTDSQCQILTSDCDNHCIHILDQNGQFLRYIDNCALKHPSDLCVDKNDNLFVAEFYTGNIKKIKYLN